ncbi:thymidylate synthase [Methanopyrus sp.]
MLGKDRPLVVRGRTLEQVWRQAVTGIKIHGEKVKRERGPVKEVRGLIAHLEPSGPESFDIPDDYPLDEHSVRAYEDQLLDPEPRGFEYTYGNRLRRYFGLDQVEKISERLSTSRNTRRAVAATWDPRRDLDEEEVPCLTALQLQSDGDHGLELHAFYRSWDVGKALVANMIALRRLQEHVAERAGLKPTTLTVYAANAHVYEEDLSVLP